MYLNIVKPRLLDITVHQPTIPNKRLAHSILRVCWIENFFFPCTTLRIKISCCNIFTRFHAVITVSRSINIKGSRLKTDLTVKSILNESEPLDNKCAAEIHYCVELCGHATTGDPYPYSS
jgi:hypothetical protein